MKKSQSCLAALIYVVVLGATTITPNFCWGDCLPSRASSIPCVPPSVPPNPGNDVYNVVLIVADDVGVDLVGRYADGYYDSEGYAENRPCTPNLDALAAQGVRFTNAWSSPLCSPSRSQILTGRPAYHTGIGQVVNPTQPERVGLDPDIMTIGDFVQPSAAIGKWHLADESQWPEHPKSVGFDSFTGLMGNFGEDWDSQSYTNWVEWTDDCSPVVVQEPGSYLTEATTDAAIAKLDAFDAQEPWLLYVAYNAVHVPFHCPPCPSDPVTSLCGTTLASCQTNWCADCAPGNQPARARAAMQVLDAEIGRLLASPAVSCENTVVIFVGDNGTDQAATAAPFDPGHAKGKVYQGGINVPLIIRCPQGLTNTINNQLVSVQDLFATIAHFVGFMDAFPMDTSYSLRGYVQPAYSSTTVKRCFVYSELFDPTFRPNEFARPPEYHAMRHLRAIRNNKYKLLELFDNGAHTYELYRMYRTNTFVPTALPHNPELLDDDADDIDSAFEKVNLYDGSMTAEQTNNFNELKCYLDTVYPALPIAPWVSNIAPWAVLSADEQDECSDAIIKVGNTPTGESRAFLQFNVAALTDAGATVLRVMLDVAVKKGTTGAAATIGVFPMPNDYDLQCAQLFDGAGAQWHALTEEWVDEEDFCAPIVKSFDLGLQGRSDLQSAVDNPTEPQMFSVALKMLPATFTAVELFNKNDQPPNDLYALRVYYEDDLPVKAEGVEGATNAVHTFRPSESYPNPSRGEATIAYSLRQSAHVSLQIVNAQGQLVRTLVDYTQPAADRHEIVWDGTNERGERVGSGVYFSHLSAEGVSETRRIVIVK